MVVNLEVHSSPPARNWALRSSEIPLDTQLQTVKWKDYIGLLKRSVSGGWEQNQMILIMPLTGYPVILPGTIPKEDMADTVWKAGLLNKELRSGF